MTTKTKHKRPNNLLLDAEKYFGTEKADADKFAQYLTNSLAGTNLTETDKSKVLNLALADFGKK